MSDDVAVVMPTEREHETMASLASFTAEVILAAIIEYRIANIGKNLGNRSLHRYMLFGPPSVGKSSWSYLSDGLRRLFGGQPPVYNIVLHEESGPDDFLSQMGLDVQDGCNITPTRFGPAPLAMGCTGKPGILLIDELNNRSDTSSAILHAVLDDLDRCRLRLPTGEVVEPHPNYTVVCTSNKDPNQYLDEALVDRFDVVLPWVDYAQGILDALPDPWDKVLSQYKRTASYSWNRGNNLADIVTFRAIRNMLTLTDVFAAHLQGLTGDADNRQKHAQELAAFLTFGKDTYKEILSVAASHEA